MKTKRAKKRSDRNHVVYRLIGPDGSSYIGMTVMVKKTPLLAVKRRWQKHVSRANREAPEWNLYEAIRQYGADKFQLLVLEVVRGRKIAFDRERAWMDEIQPELNTHIKKVA